MVIYEKVGSVSSNSVPGRREANSGPVITAQGSVGSDRRSGIPAASCVSEMRSPGTEIRTEDSDNAERTARECWRMVDDEILA